MGKDKFLSSVDKFAHQQSAITNLIANIPLSPSNTVSPVQLIQHIAEKYTLNHKQWITFQIVSSFFLQLIYPEEHSMRMLMTGPGGTGKSHVVLALHTLMSRYGQGHLLRFLAPTGSAAANIDGSTIHKAFGLSIQKKQKGKGNRKPELRKEWKGVWMLLLDESSLCGEQLMCDIDHA
ncbi:hypothetical protein BJ138DRAFT_1019310, partial [Hygrophoropsis aurantiaca]